MSEEQRIREVIEQAWDERAKVSPRSFAPDLRDALAVTMDLLDRGTLRVAEPGAQGWKLNEWLKKAVLLSFRSTDSDLVEGGYTRFYDKVPLKYSNYRVDDFRSQAARIVPPAVVRRGAFIAADVVVMPSYVNIGAYIDSGSMIDTWATVGSCAQIGRNVHISGGAGIGGVLEPLQAAPTIIEDDCFIGARSEIVEGVIVEKGAVVSMGVFIGQSTKIYDREKDEVIYGKVPAGSVVVPGSLPADDGRYSLACAVIVKRVDARTRAKTSINELLRNV